MKAYLNWQSKSVKIVKSTILLFCFEEKCMSGRILKIANRNNLDEFEISVEFIEPNYFLNELVEGNIFTVREASIVLGKGIVIEI